MPSDRPAQTATNSTVPRARVAAALTWAGVVVLMLLGTWATYWAEQRTDQYQLIHLGQCVYEGGRMYVDCWENKPPGLAWINALGIALSDGGQLGAWLLPGLTGLLSFAAFGAALKRALSPATARLALLLAATIATLRLYDAPSINPDFYSAMFELAAFSLWMLAFEAPTWPRRLLWALAAGLLWAAALTVKQTGMIGLLLVSVVTLSLLLFPRLERKNWFITTVGAWLGFLLGVMLVVGVLAWRGTLGEAHEAIFGFNRDLLAWDHLYATALSAWNRRMLLDPMHLPLWLGFVGLVATCVHSPAGRITRATLMVLVLWWLAQVLLALAGPHLAQRYWQATWPALFWLAAVGIYHLEGILRRLEPPQRLPGGILCVTVLLLLGWPLCDHYRYGLARSHLAYDRPVTERARLLSLGEEINALLPPEVPIYVWAYSPQTYLYSQHPAVCRFNYPRSSEQMEEIISTLEAGKAQAILIPHRRRSMFTPWCDETCQQRRAQLLLDYEMTATVGEFEVWQRRGEQNSRPS